MGKVELEWQKIEDEARRTYRFPGGERIEVHCVVALCVRPSGNHRLETQDGTKVIVKAGWLAIEIVAKQWSV